MALRVRLHPGAETDLTEAAVFYSMRTAALGEAFVKAVRAGFDLIGENPRLWPAWPERPHVRRRVLAKFPYAIIYSVELEEEVLILAIEHCKRRPGYWLERLDR